MPLWNSFGSFYFGMSIAAGSLSFEMNHTFLERVVMWFEKTVFFEMVDVYDSSMLCSLTRPPDTTAQTLMKRKSIVGLESKRSKHGGRDVKIGWHTIKITVNRLYES